MREPRATLEEPLAPFARRIPKPSRQGCLGTRWCPMGSTRNKPPSDLGPEGPHAAALGLRWLNRSIAAPPGSWELPGRLQQSRLEEPKHPPTWQRPHGGHPSEAGAARAEVAGRIPGESGMPAQNQYWGHDHQLPRGLPMRSSPVLGGFLCVGHNSRRGPAQPQARG